MAVPDCCYPSSKPRRRRRAGYPLASLVSVLLASACLHADAAPTTAPADTQRLLKQREAFKSAYDAAGRGDRTLLDRHTHLLFDYLLYPDVLGAWLASDAGLQDNAAIERYLQRYGGLRPARRLQTRWLKALAKREDWRTFVDVYSRLSHPNSNTPLTCQWLQGRLNLLARGGAAPGETARLIGEGMALWMVGHSQPNACEAIFSFLERSGKLDSDAYQQRITLALADKEVGLARHLALKAGAADQARVKRFARMRANPATVLTEPGTAALAAQDPDWLYYGFDRLAYGQPDLAQEHWDDLRPQLSIPQSVAFAISKRIALSFARDLAPQAAMHLDRVGFDDPQMAAWRLRTALREQDWLVVLAAFEKLPEEERERDLWRYWQGRALAQIGESQRAQTVLEGLARERSYHGFLAADQIGAQYHFNPEQVAADERRLSQLGARLGFRRARELRAVQLPVLARSEWNAALEALPASTYPEVAVLAHRWGWHDSAIRAASQAKLWDALDIRFPLPYRESFERHAKANGIEPAYALGIARSESLFMPDAISHAGALGLMQIMPRTGQGLARELGIHYKGRQTLFEPVTAIALGTRHLSAVMNRFDRNPALAAAAYNAGASRVQSWLPADQPLPADAWVDSVPFEETRHYVRRVLMAQAIFDYQLAQTTRRLSQTLRPVPTPEQLERLTEGKAERIATR